MTVNSGLGGALNAVSNPFGSSFGPLYDHLNALSSAAELAPVGNYQSVQVGLAVDFTDRNRTALANHGTSLIEAKRLGYVQAQTEQAIQAQVRNALQAIQTARQRITAAETSERAAKEKLESETRLFQTGESTNFFVLTRQNEYLDARRRAVLAHLDFNKRWRVWSRRREPRCPTIM